MVVDSRRVILDVGESAYVRSRISSHDRAACWKRNGSGSIGVAVCYTTGRIISTDIWGWSSPKVVGPDSTVS